MKKNWTKFGAIVLACVMATNIFIPCVAALDIAPPEPTTGAVEAEKDTECFTVKSSLLDFGRISELGRSYTKEIVVNNKTKKDVIIDATIEKHPEAGDANSKLSDWIAFVGGVSHFNVAAGATRNLSVRILAPADATVGSQYAIVKLADTDGHFQKVVARVDVGGDKLRYSSEVADGWVDPVRLDEKINGRVTVKNTGTAGFSSTYQLKAKNVFGGSDWTIIREVSEEVYPDKEVQFTSEEGMGYGVYAVEQRVTFVNSEGRMIESLVSRTVINLPWWGLAIAGGVLVLIIIIVIAVKMRKKSKKREEKLKRAEKKARKAEIERIEEAEEKALEKEEEAKEDEESEEDEEDDEEEVETLDNEEEADAEDEIDRLAKQLDKNEASEDDDDEEGDDEEYEEGEAIPIKVTIKKSSKKS